MSKRWLWFKDPEQGPVRVELHDVDAVHALATDPDNWSVDKPTETKAEEVPEEETDE